MLPVKRERRTREGGAARESKNEPEKKGRSARGGMPDAETCLGATWNVSACRCREVHANAAVFDARRKRRICSPIVPLTATRRRSRRHRS
jgi:hypothetical protein